MVRARFPFVRWAGRANCLLIGFLACSAWLAAGQVSAGEFSWSDRLDEPDGSIVYVNQATRHAYLDVGRVDVLPVGTAFGVYPRSAGGGAAGRKAVVRVVAVVGDHLARATIVESTDADPVMVGDEIYTPFWYPGKRAGYALAGKFDLDGDGSSDWESIGRLIHGRGGEVRAYLDDRGAARGSLDRVDYLVIGERPAKNAPAQYRRRFGRLISLARQRGFEVVSFEDLFIRETQPPPETADSKPGLPARPRPAKRARRLY